MGLFDKENLKHDLQANIHELPPQPKSLCNQRAYRSIARSRSVYRAIWSSWRRFQGARRKQAGARCTQNPPTVQSYNGCGTLGFMCGALGFTRDARR